MDVALCITALQQVCICVPKNAVSVSFSVSFLCENIWELWLTDVDRLPKTAPSIKQQQQPMQISAVLCSLHSTKCS